MRFWITHGVLPGALLLPLILWIAATHFDLRIADALFYDAAAKQWMGAHTWWAFDLIHTAGRLLVQLTALSALIVLILSRFKPSLAAWRREALFVLCSIVLTSALAGGLKTVTNVDCPWNLDRYGGDRPYVGLLDDRSRILPQGRCYPGSHSASGFSLLCFYFVFRGRSRRKAVMFLLAGLSVGVLFAFGQESRGAHFLSHDLTSAVLAWYMLLVGYSVLLMPRKEPSRHPLLGWSPD